MTRRRMLYGCRILVSDSMQCLSLQQRHLRGVVHLLKMHNIKQMPRGGCRATAPL